MFGLSPPWRSGSPLSFRVLKLATIRRPVKHPGFKIRRFPSRYMSWRFFSPLLDCVGSASLRRWRVHGQIHRQFQDIGSMTEFVTEIASWSIKASNQAALVLVGVFFEIFQKVCDPRVNIGSLPAAGTLPASELIGGGISDWRSGSLATALNDRIIKARQVRVFARTFTNGPQGGRVRHIIDKLR